MTLPDHLQKFTGQATVSGWGTLHAGSSDLPSQLRVVTVPIVKDSGKVLLSLYSYLIFPDLLSLYTQVNIYQYNVNMYLYFKHLNT